MKTKKFKYSNCKTTQSHRYRLFSRKKWTFSPPITYNYTHYLLGLLFNVARSKMTQPPPPRSPRTCNPLRSGEYHKIGCMGNIMFYSESSWSKDIFPVNCKTRKKNSSTINQMKIAQQLELQREQPSPRQVQRPAAGQKGLLQEL